jgi:hypothetical protein
MDVSAVAAPPPGSAQAGDLYVDRQTRTLWLGVDISVDPSGFLLISDIVALQAEDADIRLDNKAYTDSQLLLKAPVANPVFTGNPRAPTPLTSDSDTSVATTGFVKAAMAAVGTSIFVKGMVMAYAGPLVDVGVGLLAGWAICNGGNGTPDLRDRFIIGAGNKPYGTKNSAVSITTAPGGSHIHTINNTVLTVANLPVHNHGGVTGWMSANHQHYVTGGTDGQGNHQHTTLVVKGSNADNGDPGALIVTSNAQANGNQTSSSYTNITGNHGHNFSAWSGEADENHNHTIPNQGSATPHGHTIVGGGGVHTHDITAIDLRETLPYYALAYIMKL